MQKIADRQGGPLHQVSRRSSAIPCTAKARARAAPASPAARAPAISAVWHGRMSVRAPWWQLHFSKNSLRRELEKKEVKCKKRAGLIVGKPTSFYPMRQHLRGTRSEIKLHGSRSRNVRRSCVWHLPSSPCEDGEHRVYGRRAKFIGSSELNVVLNRSNVQRGAVGVGHG